MHSVIKIYTNIVILLFILPYVTTNYLIKKKINKYKNKNTYLVVYLEVVRPVQSAVVPPLPSESPPGRPASERVAGPPLSECPLWVEDPARPEVGPWAGGRPSSPVGHWEGGRPVASPHSLGRHLWGKSQQILHIAVR